MGMEDKDVLVVIVGGLLFVGIIITVFLARLLMSNPSEVDAERGSDSDDDNIGTAA